MVAQAQPQALPTPAKRNELGAYARDLPRGAAAPSAEEKPPLADNLGKLTWSVAATAKPDAKAYFDQAYRLAWSFNHAEAARSFRAAQALDPTCALCLWGEAWVLGPHINYPIEADANARAVAVLDEARRLVAGTDDIRAALIEALSRRYSPDPQADRATLNGAYAAAMEAVQARFPEDADVALLTADALMNLSPWDYWSDGGRTPKGATERMVALIEGVLGDRQHGPLAANPDHPGAIHLYIHAVEASDRPERAAPHAARLEGLMPGAGHLVHMPSHIWYRIGRWRESLDANLRAAAADEAQLGKGGASLLYSQGYFAHNVHFILASALMGGDGDTALRAAEKLATIVTDRAKRDVPWTQPIAAAPYAAHARFSPAATVLALPPPGDDFPFIRAMWHYARGVAFARQGKAERGAARKSPPSASWRGHPGSPHCPRRACPVRTSSPSPNGSSRRASRKPPATTIRRLSSLPKPRRRKTSCPIWSRPSGLIPCNSRSAQHASRKGRPRRPRRRSARPSSARPTTAGPPPDCCAPPRRAAMRRLSRMPRPCCSGTGSAKACPSLDQL